MKIVLLQDEIYLPTLAGGTKANRCLLEEFVRHGHECLALTRALTGSSEGPTIVPQFFEEMRSRSTTVHTVQTDVFSYEHQGVKVEALNFSDEEARGSYLEQRIQSIQPDGVFVADDKRRFMLGSALQAAPHRVILLLQTIVQLPFGPLSVGANSEYADLMREAAAIVVISDFARQYMLVHGQLESHLLPIPVYGKGPFPDLARFDAGFITMINPCELKGLEIFLALARAYPNARFATVPTWGADDNVLSRLDALKNVQILKPADDIEEILARTRILLVPSLWPETFGYVVPEAMLRGIPVLASNVGGLPEAKLGVDYLLEVAPAEWRDGAFVSPPQEISAWSQALARLLFDKEAYERCSQQSRQAALQFVAGVSIASFETLMAELVEKRRV